MVGAWDAWADRHDLTGVRGCPYWGAAAMAVWMVVLVTTLIIIQALDPCLPRPRRSAAPALPIPVVAAGPIPAAATEAQQ